MNLLFERFLSKERAEPPDIDLDIAHERREEVIQHVYEKYGRAARRWSPTWSATAALGGTRPGQGAGAGGDDARPAGQAAAALGRGQARAPRRAGLDPASPVHGQLLELANEALDFPRHLSIHPGGFLLGHEPVSTIVPIENATMEGRTVIQWDKNDVEDLGLFKVDLLGLGALAQLDRIFAC